MSKVLFVVSPTINALVDPRKGTTGNKIDCATKHLSNATISNATICAAGGLTALAGRAALAVSKTPLVGSTFKKVLQCIKAAPSPVKIAAGAVAALSILYRTYKAGIIEQKYIDRAQFVDHTFTDDEPTKPGSKVK